MSETDTIVAVASAPGGGIGVVRVSGPSCRAIAQALLGGGECPPPRHAAFRPFVDAGNALIDQGIAIYFPAPHSYTGEDVLELQAHGGAALMHLLLMRCLELGARQADPGEFTRRAYLNDKLDLAQAEAVADVIAASTAEAARSAARSLAGEFSSQVRGLRDRLIELRMYVEACLDFPEEDLDFIQQGQVAQKLSELRGTLESIATSARQGNLLRDGMQVVLIGQPNVGKSSLMNRLAGEELAIVTPIAGTTRDAISGAIQINGIPLYLTDTAGLRETADVVEQEGIARTWRALEKAHVALLLVDANHGITVAEEEILARLPAALPRVWIHNKIDLVGGKARRKTQAGATHIYLSAFTGAGLELLRAELLELAGWRAGNEGVFMARARHLDALKQVSAHLLHAADRLAQPELLAEELRLAQEALGNITGEFTPDDLLGEIFSRFCIGK